jgi:hypothetical protein
MKTNDFKYPEWVKDCRDKNYLNPKDTYWDCFNCDSHGKCVSTHDCIKVMIDKTNVKTGFDQFV